MAVNTREDELQETDKVYRVLEFYSGIGGMHYAAKGCGFKTEVVAALEINTTANSVYKHNFPGTPLWQCNIEGLTIKDLSKLAADVFLMSPPCQPFTRVGLKGASSDPRSKSFLHIMNLLSRLPNPPDYILMENVKGFETSDTRELFINTLKEAGYTYQEFLLSPSQFGIPNSRLRYYMLAKRKPLKFNFETQEQVLNHNPNFLNQCEPNNLQEMKGCNKNQQHLSSNHVTICNDKESTCTYKNRIEQETGSSNIHSCIATPSSLTCTDTSTDVLTKSSRHGFNAEDNQSNQRVALSDTNSQIQQTLLTFLEIDGNKDYFDQFLLPEKVLSRFALVLDIVTPSSTHCCCFTKAYGHYAEGTGSVLKMADIDDTDIFKKYRALSADTSNSQRAAVLSGLKLRYFTPREVANIMCFPKTLGFPCGTSVKQQYRLLGNSLNVHVVTELLKCLMA